MPTCMFEGLNCCCCGPGSWSCRFCWFCCAAWLPAGLCSVMVGCPLLLPPTPMRRTLGGSEEVEVEPVECIRTEDPWPDTSN